MYARDRGNSCVWAKEGAMVDSDKETGQRDNEREEEEVETKRENGKESRWVFFGVEPFPSLLPPPQCFLHVGPVCHTHV